MKRSNLLLLLTYVPTYGRVLLHGRLPLWLIALSALFLPRSLYAQCDPAPAEQILCAGESVQIDGAPAGSGTYLEHSWEILGVSTAANVQLLQADEQIVTVDLTSPDLLTGTLFLHYQVSDDAGCTGEAILELSVLAPPAVSIEGAADLCADGEPILLEGKPANGAFSSFGQPGLTDHGDGTASFDPADAGIGLFLLAYTAAAGGCPATATAELEVLDCPPPAWQLLAPCSCQTGNGGQEGNATTLENGQFIETIQVTSQPGENWYLLGSSGFYDPASPAPPAAPVAFATGPDGKLLSEQAPGVYELEGIHIDAQGYAVQLTNGADTLLATNICYYPEPAIVGLDEGYCLGDDPVQLQAETGGANGAGLFSILAENGDPLQSDVSAFAPGQFGTGHFQVEYLFDEQNAGPCENCNPGCVQVVSQAVEVAAGDEAPVCNDFVNIALDGDCSEEILPDLVLEGSYESFVVYEVQIYSGNNLIGNTVTAEHLDQTLTVKVVNTCNDDYCWGEIHIEDKWAPQFDCPTTVVEIPCTTDAEAVPPPPVFDNCDVAVDADLVDESITAFDCDDGSGLIERIEREWTATDASGNQAVNCLQIIEWQRSDLDEVVFPLNRDDIQGPSVDCADADISPANTGYPTVGGLPVGAGTDFCSITATYTDLQLPSCGGGFKIARSWTLTSDCSDTPVEHVQVIKVADLTPPVLTCPAPTTVSVNTDDCTAAIFLPEIDITDNCSGFSVSVNTPQGVVNGNGGFVSGLPIGTYSLQYKAIDECGNLGSCQFELSVADLVAPVTICDEFTVAALDADGSIEVLAVNLDDGSFDNCTDIGFSVRRMDDPGDFQPQAVFDCDDVAASPIMVAVKVTDEYGNENTCMVEVTVQDKLSPALTCPDDVVLLCEADPGDPALTGTPTVLEACEYELNVSESDDIAQCGTGMIVRQYTAVDVSGNSSSCTQKITIEDDDPFTEEDIIWPEDIEVSECESLGLIEPDSLPDGPGNYQYPIILDNPCSLIGINYEDQFFDVASPACFKIVRTWRVLDWCQYDSNDPDSGGLWEYQQTIKVVDNTPPEVECDFSPFVKLTEPFCYDTVTLPYPMITDCSPEVEVFVQSDLGQGFGPFLEVPLGAYDVSYTVVDNCGNSTICEFTLQVLDGKKPSPVCVNGIVAEVMQTGMVPIWVSMFEAGSFDNCTASEDLIRSFSQYDYTDTVRFYTCDEIGPNTLEFWVTDEAGNADFCEITIFIQDNMNVCNLDLLSVAGLVQTEEIEGVAGVEVNVSGNQAPPYLTLADGVYAISNLPPGGDYTLVPSKTDDPVNGVTTYDLALLTKHILGVQPLDSPYKIIAADVNHSETITTLDVVELRKLILLLVDDFPNNTSWRFVDAAFIFPDPADPFATPFPEVLNFNNLSADVSNADFVAVKVGDLNGNAQANASASAEDRQSGTPLLLTAPDLSWRAGETVIVPLRGSELQELSAYQFALRFDPAVLWLQEVLPGQRSAAEDFGLARADEGLFTASWFDLAPFDVQEADLFRLRFTALQDGRLSDLLRLDRTAMPALGYAGSGMAREVEWHFSAATDESEQPLLLPVRPNPFRDQLELQFLLPAPMPVSLTITDLSGKVVWQWRGEQAAGHHRIALNGDELPDAGIYFCRMEAGEVSNVQRLVRIK